MTGPFSFAWAGGTIQDQLTLVVNGTTHGARLDTVTLVGDVQTGNRQLTNVSDTGGLQVGTLYSVSDTAGTAYFIYDDSVLAGLPSSINLSVAPDFSAQSATFLATKSIVLGVALGTMSHGSAGVSLVDVPGLPAGLYAIAGTGIGETTVPTHITDGTTITSGGGITIVGTAFFNYDGAGHGDMFLYAASAHTHVGGDTGLQTTYTVAAQQVRATASGTFPVEIFGYPTGDPYVIDNIPPGALADMTPDLLYNISGNGIQPGAVCQRVDDTTLSLDLAATSSEINAILTLTGPRTPNAPFDPAVHNRFDEDIISVEIAQEEGGFATLTVGMKNPNIGLLAFGRNLWCWLSWDQAWTPGGTASPDLVPLFNGRLVGVPKLQAGEIVELEFLGRPDDMNYQKDQLAQSLSVLPYYDPVWLTTATVATSPDTVLETYSALWHIDRTTLAVTISDIVNGEDGTVDIDADQAIYDNFSLQYGQPPLAAITVAASVSWQQQAEGTIDVTQNLLNAFSHVGSSFTQTFPVDRFGGGGGGMIQVLGGDGMQSDWPRPGTSAGGGWSLATRTDYKGVPLNYIIEATINLKGGFMPQTYYTVTYSAPLSSALSLNPNHGSIVTVPYAQYKIQFPLNIYKIRMNLDFRANRTRTETLNVVVAAGVQRVLSDSAESDRQDLTIASAYVDKGVDPNGTIPIGNAAYRSYFKTDRGNDSVQYVLLLARAKLRARARAVDITFAVPWQAALGITLRHNVQLTDPRLPGGHAIGKVKSYKLSVSAGKQLGEFTIGCSVGTGEAMTPQAGVNAWANAGYVNPGYQRVIGAQLSVGEGDLACQTLDDFVVADDGIDFTNLSGTQFVNECVVIHGITEQVGTLAPFNGSVSPTNGDPIGSMEKMTTTVTIDLKPVQGSEFHTEFFPAVTQLTLPKTIDLAATSGG